MTIRAAILQCDRVLDRFQPQHGDYPQMIERMFAEAGFDAIAFDVWDCTRQQYPEQTGDYDFFITTGSKADAWSDEPWVLRLLDFTRELDRAGHRLIGICFGHQIIARALGGQVAPSDKGWGVGIADNELLACRDWMEPCPERLRLIVSHQDQVTQLPGKDEQVLAGNDFCPFFMLQWNGHFMSVQGHPEWHADYARALLEDRRGRIDAQLVERALLELQQEQPDNRLFTRWIMHFIDSAP